MAYIGNSPEQQTVLRLEARKSFALSLWFMDQNRRPADLTGSVVRLVAKRPPFAADPGDAGNLIEHSLAEFPDPTQGFARFELQAAELDLAAGEYPFVVVLVNDGYSSVVVKGVIAVEENPEFSSMESTYDDVQAPAALDVLMRGAASIDVICGPVIPPGFTWMSDADKQKVDSLSVAGNLLPPGGQVRDVLAKRSDDDYDFVWQEPQSFDGTLSAASVATGRAPVSNGSNAWSWWPVPSRTTTGQNGMVPVANSSGSWAWGPSPYAAPTHLDSVTDLDTVVTTGLRHCNSNTVAADPLLHYPAPFAGLLETHSNGMFVYQRYTVYASASSAAQRKVWVRAKYSTNAWTAWGQLSVVGHTHAAADVTSGELDAARVPRVIDLRGISRGTADPPGGADGDLYIKVLP